VTCEICVMNRHAAVLAADSASTVTEWIGDRLETRYFKGANKIFQLSRHQPVGVMIFDSADLLHVPWEVLIKGFRDELATDSFKDLDGYAGRFFAFLNGNARYFPEAARDEQFTAAVQRVGLQFVFSVIDDIGRLNEVESLSKLQLAIRVRESALDKTPLPGRLSQAALQQAHARHHAASMRKLGDYLPLSTQMRQSLASLAINEVFRRPAEFFSTAGLVLAGFGDHDIFPRMIEYRSSGMLEGTQVIEEVKREGIDHDTPAALNAFAQTSMSDTFSLGFSKDVYVALMDTLSVRLKEFATSICGAVGANPAKIGDLEQMISQASSSISDGWFERARREHAYPLKRVLGALPVEEIAELAETLINLQSLKEKVTKPSASVGGPVDVAVITRNEGFVWIKRKVFFDPQKNPGVPVG
jgi:hypothetical protein